jgi:hypothetical protein
MDDYNDLLYDEFDGRRIWVVAKVDKRTTLHDYPILYICELVQRFGELGGFERILVRLEEETCPMEILAPLVHAVANVNYYLHHNVAKEIVLRLWPAV